MEPPVNNKQRIINGVVVGLAIVLAVFWYVRAPFSTLTSIRVAAEHRDTSELSRLIDFPALKTSLKLLISDSVNAQTGSGAGIAAGLTRIFAGALASPVVEALVTPESIASMFAGQLPSPSAQAAQSQRAEGDKSDLDTTYAWDGISTVRIRINSKSLQNQGLVFVMRRDGLSWRLATVER